MLTRLFVALPLIGAALLTPAPLLLAQTQSGSADPGAAGRRLLADLTRAGTDLAVEGLASWITASRKDAIRAGVAPVPPAIRAKLKGHFPEALLGKVRYRVGNGHDLSLQTNAFQGNAVAITLGDVILFRSADDAARDATLWAHELTHVQQYDRWTIRGFARRYTLDHAGVEREAELAAARYAGGGKPAAK